MSIPMSYTGVVNQIDYIDYLSCPSDAREQDNFVLSAEFKIVDARLEAEILVTGYVQDWKQEAAGQMYLVPLLAIQLPLAPLYIPGLSTKDRGTLAEETGVKAIRAISCELLRLARLSLQAGGLRDLTLSLKDLRPESPTSGSFDIREARQNRKMHLAIAHTEMHWKLRPDKNLEHFEAGKYRIARSLVYFSNVYSLARGIGVKEIRPRIQKHKIYQDAVLDYRNIGIFSKPRRNEALIDQSTGEPRKLSEQNEFTVIVAKLRRAKFIQNQP